MTKKSDKLSKSDARKHREQKRKNRGYAGGSVIGDTLKEPINGNSVDLDRIVGNVYGAVRKQSGFNISRFSDGKTDLTRVENVLSRLVDLGYLVKEVHGHYNAHSSADPDSLNSLLYIIKNLSATAEEVSVHVGDDREITELYLEDLVERGPLEKIGRSYLNNSFYWV